jgi:hypothetical protein
MLLLLLPQCASAQCVNGVIASSNFQQLIQFLLFLLHCSGNQQVVSHDMSYYGAASKGGGINVDQCTVMSAAPARFLAEQICSIPLC